MVAVSKSSSPVAGVVDEYVAWLGKQPLSDRSRESYRAQVVAFVDWLAGFDDPDGALADGPVRDWAVRDYKRFLKTKRRLSPASVNQALAAIDNFYRSRAIGRPDVGREPAAQAAPRALDEDDQRQLLRAVDRWPAARDRAIVSLLLYTGLRLTEIADLQLDDVAVSARKGEVTVRSGKGDVFRQVPLNSACRGVLSEWFTERRQLLDTKNTKSEAVWVSRLGRPMSSRSISNVITRVADDAGIEGLSPHVLRHTFVTNLIRSGKDVVLVAELAGHRNLDTTRRYSLPTEADRADAVEDVIVEL